jgi:hypothetical protein
MSIFDSRSDRYDVRSRDISRTNIIATSLPIISDLRTGTIAVTTLTNATVLTNRNSGKIYMVVVTNGGVATDAQIIAGSGGNIVAGAASSVAVAAGALQTVASITSLTTATTYQLIALQVDGDGTNGTHSLQRQVTFTTA